MKKTNKIIVIAVAMLMMFGALTPNIVRAADCNNCIIKYPVSYGKNLGNSGDKFFIADVTGSAVDDLVFATTAENNDGIAGNNDLAWYVSVHKYFYDATKGTYYNGFADPVLLMSSYGLASDNFYFAKTSKNYYGTDSLILSTTRVDTNKQVANDLAWFKVDFNYNTYTGKYVPTDRGMINSSYGIQSNTDKYYVGDFDGDFREDILISTTRIDYNKQVTNDLAWYLMKTSDNGFIDGGQLMRSYGIQSDTDKYYVGDFNGDSKSDILVSTTRLDVNKQVNNDLAWFLMKNNGSTFTDGGVVNSSYGVNSNKYLFSNYYKDAAYDASELLTLVPSNGYYNWYMSASNGTTLTDKGKWADQVGSTNDIIFKMDSLYDEGVLFGHNINGKMNWTLYTPYHSGGGVFTL